VRDRKGGIEGMLHKEYGVGYDAGDGTPSPLADDIGGLIEIPSRTLGIVEATNETYNVSLAVDITMC
jgi:hypothetical protein